MNSALKSALAEGKRDKASFKKYFQKIKNKKPKQLDQQMRALHEEVFEEVDCLECANCCKTTSPIFRDKDIDRIAKFLQVRPAELIEQHLHLDNEGDYVLNIAPCPFLGADNYCSIYEARPRACREYPHTDRKNFHQILKLTLKNTEICPATVKIIQRLQTEMPL